MPGFTTRRTVLAGGLAAGLTASLTEAFAADQADAAPAWRKLSTEPFPGKQDDTSFVSPDLGWYGNGKGKVFRTRDGGETWEQVFEKPGTFVRAIGFLDEQRGFLGNIGTGRFPGVTDETPLYVTADGGASWSPAKIVEGPPMPGVCAIDIFRQPFIDRGQLAQRVQIRAGGRVGGPAFVLESLDGGEAFVCRDLNSVTAAILDIKFISETVGFIAGASNANVNESSARILKTTDGGKTWRIVYESKRPWEITWKLSFPSAKVGYCTLQSYNPDKTVTARFALKTMDGGDTWIEQPLIDDFSFRAFGVGFVSPKRGWIGGTTGGLETQDGGATWTPVAFGRAVNKIRVVPMGKGARVFAIGVEVHRLDVPKI